MYVVVNGFSLTGFDRSKPIVPYDSIRFSQNINDPLPQCTFDVEDPGSQYAVSVGQEVIIFDENAPPVKTISGGTIPTVPSHNLCKYPDLLTDTTQWPASGNLSGLVTRPGGSVMTMTFNNSAFPGQGAINQQTLTGYVKPGQKYMFSMYLTIATALTNARAFIQMDFLDSAGFVISGSTVGFDTGSVTNNVRKNISGTAPANAVFVYLTIGGTTTASTNSGTLQWATPQLEPMWFVVEGVSYPTPDCNFQQSNCVEMPDGTASRSCRVFAGYINDIMRFYQGKNRIYTVSCAGPGAILENSLVSHSASTAQDTIFISDTVNTYFSGKVSYGFPNVVSPLPLVAGISLTAQFTDVSFRNLINTIVELSGFQYRLDWYYIIRYNPMFYEIAKFALSDNPDNISSFAFFEYRMHQDGTQQKFDVKVVGDATTHVSRVVGQNSASLNAPSYVTPSFSTMVTDGSLTATSATVSRGLAELTKYGGPRTILTLSSAQYAEPGQAIYITNAQDGIDNDPFVVQKVSGRCLGAGKNEYAYELGAYNPSVIEHIKNMTKKLSTSTQTTAATPAQTDIVFMDDIVYSELPITFT